jgi:ubiquinone/menaquinone biosynthesis C-methylase UbiE
MTKEFWKKVWDAKGESASNDLLYLDGYEHLNIDFNSDTICDKIVATMNISPGDRVLEVGCGAGFLARELQVYDYVGVDYSQSLINKHAELFENHTVMVAEGCSLPFDDGSFDKVFCFGVMQYFPSRDYADKALDEMKRVARSSIFLGDLKIAATRQEHFVYPQNDLEEQGYQFTECLYVPNDVERYNAFLELENDLE